MRTVYLITWFEGPILCQRAFENPGPRAVVADDLKATDITYHLTTCTVEA
ncbi:hypothetical protein AB0383_20215 [Amycolatopsis sp. NPDC051373]